MQESIEKRATAQTLNVAHKSFLDDSQKYLETALNLVASREDKLRSKVITTLREDPGYYSELANKGEQLTLSEAKDMAIMEGATLITQHPRLLIQTVHFINLYRIVRTSELAFGTQRGGKSLFIGSGVTLHEFFSMYVKPPTVDQIESLVELNILQTVITNLNHQPELLPGQVIAVEPDRKSLSSFEKVSKDFKIPEGMIQVSPITIGEAIEEDFIPNELDQILWHRAEPSIITGDDPSSKSGKGKRRSRQTSRQLLQNLFDHLRRSGNFITTIGRGNNKHEFFQRRRFLKDVLDLMPKYHARVLDMPLYFENPEDKLLFEGGDHNTVGCLIAVKQTE